MRVAGTVQTAPAGANKILVLHAADRRRRPGDAVELPGRDGRPARSGPRWRPAAPSSSSRPRETPLTALAIAQILDEAGVPAGVVNVLPARSAGAGRRRMLDDPRVRKLSFTGSTEVGRRLLEPAPPSTVVSCSMELGGNAPFLVLRRRRPRRRASPARWWPRCATAARRAPRPTASTSQRRSPRSSSARLAEAHGRPARRPGPRRRRPGRARWSTSPPRDKVDELVQRRGRRRRRGAHRRLARPTGRGFFYAPTVLAGVRAGRRDPRARRSSGRSRRSSPFDTEDEAIALANDTEYGLVVLRLHRRPRAGPAGRGGARVGHGRPQPRASSPTRRRRSAAPSRAASAARAATRACSSTWRASTSPSTGDQAPPSPGVPRPLGGGGFHPG